MVRFVVLYVLLVIGIKECNVNVNVIDWVSYTVMS